MLKLTNKYIVSDTGEWGEVANNTAPLLKSDPLSSELGTYETVKARFVSGRSP